MLLLLALPCLRLLGLSRHRCRVRPAAGVLSFGVPVAVGVFSPPQSGDRLAQSRHAGQSVEPYAVRVLEREFQTSEISDL